MEMSYELLHAHIRSDGRWTRLIFDWIPEDGYRHKGLREDYVVALVARRWRDVLRKFGNWMRKV